MLLLWDAGQKRIGREARERRDEIADAVSAGYAEAMIRAQVWNGSRQRWWHPAPPALTPQQAEAAFDRIAAMFPGRVN